MAASQANPDAMILGTPVFGPEAPALRIHGRKISNWWTRLETAGAIHDSYSASESIRSRPFSPC